MKKKALLPHKEMTMVIVVIAKKDVYKRQEKVYVNYQNIKPCLGCNVCQKTKECIQKDVYKRQVFISYHESYENINSFLIR